MKHAELIALGLAAVAVLLIYKARKMQGAQVAQAQPVGTISQQYWNSHENF